jgi:hypothetical protein
MLEPRLPPPKESCLRRGVLDTDEALGVGVLGQDGLDGGDP